MARKTTKKSAAKKSAAPQMQFAVLLNSVEVARTETLSAAAAVATKHWPQHLDRVTVQCVVKPGLFKFVGDDLRQV